MSQLILNAVLPPKSNKRRKYKTRPINDVRRIALENGEKYYQGNPCKHNHCGKRITRSGQCVECRSINKRATWPKYRNRVRNWELKKNFGITIEQYEEMLKCQNGLCAICNKPETSTNHITKKPRSLAVDHCHETGKVRGLLCYTCNVTIGQLKHNPDLLRKAAMYCEAI